MGLFTPSSTDRIGSRPYRLIDLAAVIEMFDDPEAKRWYPTKSEPEEVKQWIQWNLDTP
jgi:RimJ/RimL family protein N-acetyltransferase